MQRSAGITLAQRLWQSFASSSCGASTSSIVSSSGGGGGGLAAALSDALIWMGTRDPKTRRGKIFKGSFGKSRPRKAPVNPHTQPPPQQQMPIPYPPNWQPSGTAGAAVLV